MSVPLIRKYPTDLHELNCNGLCLVQM
jgi:hypothetical protein